MKERRISERLNINKLMITEYNGDYMHHRRAINLSEEGIFIENKFCGMDHEPFSKLSFTLPNGKKIHNIVAKIVREQRTGTRLGSAYEFMKISEHDRMELKRFFAKQNALSKAF